MLQSIFRILGAIFFVWLFRRLLVSLLGTAKKNQPTGNSTIASNQMVKDPVCGMYMDSRLAVRLESKRENFYFCSEECKNKYLSNPAGTNAAGSAPPGP
jgi:YHS domain-containing protein